MSGLTGMTGLEIAVLILDFLVLFVFFYFIIKNMQTMRMKGSVKALTVIFTVWIIARFTGMEMTVTVFSTMMGYVLFLAVILFPKEFRKMLDRFGRKRSILWSKDKLLGKKERLEVAEAMIDLSRKRQGFLMVIAKGSGLEDYIENGDILGEVAVTKDVIMSLSHEDSNFNDGALIVRDNMIISANSTLPIARKDDLIKAGAGSRHLAALGITYAEDCVALVVSATTGRITIASKKGEGLNYHFALETREHNIRQGLDEKALARRIDEALTGKESKDDESVRDKMSREDREKMMKERKEKREREKEEKRKELEERKKMRKEGKNIPKKKKGKSDVGEDKPKSRGFGGYGG